MVSTRRKKLSSKVTVFIAEKNPSPIARIKDSFKNKFPLDRKKSFSGKSLWKKKNIYIYINGLYWPENKFSLPGMKHSLKNTFPRYGKTAFFDKKIEKNGFQ